MSKGTSAVVKTRGVLKQALFSQAVSDKNSTLEVIHFLPKLGTGTSACCICTKRLIFSITFLFFFSLLGGVQGQVDALKQVLDSFNTPADLRWTWGEGGTERALEKSWTDLVHSHEVWMYGRERELEGIGNFPNPTYFYSAPKVKKKKKSFNALRSLQDVLMAIRNYYSFFP